MQTNNLNPRTYKYLSNKELEAIAEALAVMINHTRVTAYRMDAHAKFNAIRRNLQGRGYDLNAQGRLIENK